MKIENQEFVLKLLSTGRYSCTRDGDVFSYYLRGNFLRKSPIKLRPGLHSDGYMVVNLCDGYGYKVVIFVHQLVWLSHNGAIANGLQINHINAVKHDNRFHNLELVTPKQNTKHARVMGLRISKFSKLMENDVHEIKKLYASGDYSYRELARMFGVCATLVGCIIREKKWRRLLPNKLDSDL